VRRGPLLHSKPDQSVAALTGSQHERHQPFVCGWLGFDLPRRVPGLSMLSTTGGGLSLFSAWYHAPASWLTS